MSPTVPRLKRRTEFLRVARSGRRWAAPGLVLQAWRRTDAADRPAALGRGIRVGFTASRKVGGAVQRNRAKRRLRAVAEEILPTHGRDGYDYVLIGRAGTLERPYAALLADLMTALKKVKAHRDEAPAARGNDTPKAERRNNVGRKE